MRVSCGIRRAERADARKRDARYEELEGQMRVIEIRKTKKAEQDGIVLL